MEQQDRAQQTQGLNQPLNQGLPLGIAVYKADAHLVGGRARGVQAMANLSAGTYLEEAKANATKYWLELEEAGGNTQVRAGHAIPVGTLVSLGIGRLHVQDRQAGDRLGDGVPYHNPVDLGQHSPEVVRLQIQPSRGGILEGNHTINLFH
jgi:hypothetical protein